MLAFVILISPVFAQNLAYPWHLSRIYVQDDTTGAVSIWFMNGASRVATASVADGQLGWHLAAAADFDQNGVTDLVWQHDSGLATVWLMGGSTGGELQSWSFVGDGGSAWRVIAAYDFDHNGVPDLIWENHETGEHTIWYMTLANGVPQMQSWAYFFEPMPGWRGAGEAFVPVTAAIAVMGLSRQSALPGFTFLYRQNEVSGEVNYSLPYSYVDPGHWYSLTPGFGPDWRVIGAAGGDLYWQSERTRQMTVWHVWMPGLGPSVSNWEFLNPSSTPGAHAIVR